MQVTSTNEFKQDNTIHFVFEKIFNQRTSDSKDLFAVPFQQIREKTFADVNIHTLINKLTNRPINAIQSYLSDMTFLNKFLFARLKKKIYVQILLDEHERFAELIAGGREIDKMGLQLMIINNRQWYEHFHPELCSNDMLMHAAEFGHEEIYFHLTNEKDLVPNDQIFYRATIGGNINTVKNINVMISVSDKILETAFQMNNTDIILYLVKDAIENEIHVSQNLISYPITNGNIELLNELDKCMVFTYHTELYFAALLSGSIDMLKYLENKMPNIHDGYALDTTKSKKEKGFSSLLTEEMIYRRGNKNFFSHTLNYAIQSKSLAIIKYIISLGYGVTASNVITAIKTGDIAAVKMIVEYYGKKLSKYFIYYFGMNSYIPNKFAVAEYILKHIDTSDTKMSVADYRRETCHLNLIQQLATTVFDDTYDPDYLLKYKIFFSPLAGCKLNDMLLVTVRLYLELDCDDSIAALLNQKLNAMEWQHVIDSIYLFGDLNKIKKFGANKPTWPVIMESLCYNQIGKFCFLLQQNKIEDCLEKLCPMIIMLNNPILNSVMHKKNVTLPHDLKFKLMSGDHSDAHLCTVDKHNLNDLLFTDDIKLVKKYDLSDLVNEHIIEWAIDADLDIASYLKSLII